MHEDVVHRVVHLADGVVHVGGGGDEHLCADLSVDITSSVFNRRTRTMPRSRRPCRARQRCAWSDQPAMRRFAYFGRSRLTPAAAY
jgi:hypothetical protein